MSNYDPIPTLSCALLYNNYSNCYYIMTECVGYLYYCYTILYLCISILYLLCVLIITIYVNTYITTCWRALLFFSKTLITFFFHGTPSRWARTRSGCTRTSCAPCSVMLSVTIYSDRCSSRSKRPWHHSGCNRTRCSSCAASQYGGRCSAAATVTHTPKRWPSLSCPSPSSLTSPTTTEPLHTIISPAISTRPLPYLIVKSHQRINLLVFHAAYYKIYNLPSLRFRLSLNSKLKVYNEFTNCYYIGITVRIQ